MPPEWIHSNEEDAPLLERSPAALLTGQIESTLKTLIGANRYEKWFAGRTSFSVHGDVLTIGLQSPFMIKWMAREFHAPAQCAAQEFLGLSAQVRFDVDTARAVPSQEATPAAGKQPGAAPLAIQPTIPSSVARSAPEIDAETNSAAVGRRTNSGRHPEAERTSSGSQLRVTGTTHRNKTANNTDNNQITEHTGSNGTASEPRDAQSLKIHAPAPGSSNGQPQPERSRLAPRRRRFALLADFVVGQSNHIALSMARKVAENPGEQYNPFYIYGSVGIGKTHLLEGIHAETRQRFPELTATYLTAEAFANYYTKALREKSLPSFRRRFRSVDVLLVDDIDFLDAKKGIQEEFCHTIQELLAYGRQVVLAADRHPRMLTNIRPDLCTRFLSGLVTRLEAPDEITRREIARRQVQRFGIPVTEDAILYIARKFSRNVRELLGAVNCLQTYHQLTRRTIGITATREVLRDLERDCLRIVRASDIQNAVCELFGIPQADLISSKRTRQLAQPRMLAMYLTRQWTQSAYHEIGQQFGGRNHSTVMSAERKMKGILERNERMQISNRELTASEIISLLEDLLDVG